MARWPDPGFSCPGLTSTTFLSTAQVSLHHSCWASEASATCWGWGGAVQMCLLRNLTNNSIAGSSGWCSSLCPERGTLSLRVCEVKGKGGSSAFSFLQLKVSPSWAAGMQLHSFCFLFLSFSPCSAKIVSVTHLYPAGKVTCGQCCKTPGGSCGCRTEMTYVKVTKYTQKLWRRKVWFQRKLSRASWDKW